MQCTCVRHTDLPNTSKLFADLVYHFDRVSDLYPHAPNDPESLIEASRFDFPDGRRAAIVAALTPINPNNSSLDLLAQPGTVAIVTGQQVGLFSGPAYSIYKALTAIRIARDLTAGGVNAVPVFWLATEDHDFAEVDHTWVFDSEYKATKLQVGGPESNGSRPVGGIPLKDIPIRQLREALAGLPFAEDAVALVERAYQPGETMGSAFGRMVRELFAPYGLLLIDPMTPAVRQIAAPLMREAVERMPELIEDLRARSKELLDRGYHAQVLVDPQTSLVFLLDEGHRIALRRNSDSFTGFSRKLPAAELAARAEQLSPNALLRPVIQDYLLPTAAYVGGAAELAYLAQSQVLYTKLLGRQPVAFPRAGFTLLDEHSRKRMARYRLAPTDLMGNDQAVHTAIASRLVPEHLRERIAATEAATMQALDHLSSDLHGFDNTLAAALETSRRKIQYQVGKIGRKTAHRIMEKDHQATRDTALLRGLVFPEKHLQERLYSIVPFIAKFGPGLIGDIYDAVRPECPDHQFVTI